MKVLRMTDTDLRNKRVLIREDLNVPVQGGTVTSDARRSSRFKRYDDNAIGFA